MGYRTLLATIGLALAAALVPAGAADTTIKCNCTCKDAVGTFKVSCYSTSSCDTCCGFGGAGAVLRTPNQTVFTEAAPGKLGVVVARDAQPKR